MPTIEVNVRTKRDLTTAFNNADRYFKRAMQESQEHPFDTDNYVHNYTIEAHGQAEKILAEIFDTQSAHRTASTFVGGGSGTAVFFVASSAAAPFLGPFCVIAGGIAAALVGKGVTEISKDINFVDLYKKHGTDFVEKIRRYPGIVRDGSTYRIKRDFTPPSGAGPAHS